MNHDMVLQKIGIIKTQLEDKGEVTYTFKREDCKTLFIILGSDPLLSDRQVHVKLNLQGGLVTLYLRRKKP